ncbi:RNA-dependent RNA polymerase [Fragaria vesca associated virus 1]|nr:RNA-dependent RNA polymerase [Fragaria vesca associated virus 1]
MSVTTQHLTSAVELDYFSYKLGLQGDKLIANTALAAITDSTSLFGASLRDDCVKQLIADARKNAQSTIKCVVISQQLSEDDQALLRTLYPEFTIKYNAKSRETHGFAHASRILESSLIMQRLGYYNTAKKNQKKIVLKDVGGSRIYHAMKGHCAVHVCAPILSMEDDIRTTTANDVLTNTPNNMNDMQRNSVELLKCPSTHYCQNKAQNCNVKAHYMMFVHSLYDMTPSDVANAMTAANTVRAMGSIIFDPLIILTKEGVLPELRVTWKKFYDNNRVANIKFSFIGDSQPAYVHSYRNYMEWITTTLICDTKYATPTYYAVRMNDNRCGIQFLTMTRLNSAHIPATTTYVDHYLSEALSYSCVTYYQWSETYTLFRMNKMKKIKLIVPTILWDQAYDALRQQSDGSFTVNKAHELVMCYNRKTIINGQTVSHKQKVASNIVDTLANALYVRVYIDKYIASQALTTIMKDVESVRKLSGSFIENAIMMCKKKFRDIFYKINTDASFLAPYSAWPVLSQYYTFPVDITAAVQSRTYVTDLPEIIQAQKNSYSLGFEQMSEKEITLEPINGTESLQPKIQHKPIYALTETSGNFKTQDNTVTSVSDIMVNNVALKKKNDKKNITGNESLPIFPSAYTNDCNIQSNEYYTKMSVPGDGNCFFHSLIAFLNTIRSNHDDVINVDAANLTPSDIRRTLIADITNDPSKYVGTNNEVLMTDIVSQLCVDKRPVDEFVVAAAALYYDITICQHYDSTVAAYDGKSTTYNPGKPVVFHVLLTVLSADCGHYEPYIYNKCDASQSDAECAEINSIDNVEIPYEQLQTMVTKLYGNTEEDIIEAKSRVDHVIYDDRGNVCIALSYLDTMTKYPIHFSRYRNVLIVKANDVDIHDMFRTVDNNIVYVIDDPIYVPDDIFNDNATTVNDVVYNKTNDDNNIEAEKIVDMMLNTVTLAVIDYLPLNVTAADYDDYDQICDRIQMMIPTLQVGADAIIRTLIPLSENQFIQLIRILVMFEGYAITQGLAEGTSSLAIYVRLENYRGAYGQERSKTDAIVQMHYRGMQEKNKDMYDDLHKILSNVDSAVTYDRVELTSERSRELLQDNLERKKQQYMLKMSPRIVHNRSERDDDSIISSVMPSGGLAIDNVYFARYIVETYMTDLLPIKLDSLMREKIASSVLNVAEKAILILDKIRESKENMQAYKSLSVRAINIVRSVVAFECSKCGKTSYVPAIKARYVTSCKCCVDICYVLEPYCIVYKIKKKKYHEMLCDYANNHNENKKIIEACHDIGDAYALYKLHITNKLFNDNWDKMRKSIIENHELISADISSKLRKTLMALGIDYTTGCDNSSGHANVGDGNSCGENRNEMKTETIEMSDESKNEKKPFSVALYDAIPKSTNVERTEQVDYCKDIGDMPRCDRLKNALLELYNIWKITDANHTSELRLIYNVASSTNDISVMVKWLTTRNDNPSVYVHGVWYPPLSDKDYMYAFDGVGCVDFKTVRLDKTYVVTDNTRRKFEPTFIEVCTPMIHSIIDITISTKFEFVSGVPGCGKTTYIMEHHGPNDLVLSATREGANDFRERAMKNHRIKKKTDRDSPTFMTAINKQYRTVYSYLYNDAKTVHEIVYIDEAMMLHPGMITAIAILTKCKTMVMVGDAKQIPYYVRVDYPAVYDKLSDIFEVTEVLYKSYRCPIDVAKYMTRYYGRFVSMSSVAKSMTAVYVSGQSNIPPSDYDVYLTFTQSDKDLLRNTYKNVYTVHEYQGKQADSVCLFRGVPTPIPVYDSEAHHIVALTRHKKHFVYATVVMDKLYDSIMINSIHGGGTTLAYTTESLMRVKPGSNIMYFVSNSTTQIGLAKDLDKKFVNANRVTLLGEYNMNSTYVSEDENKKKNANNIHVYGHNYTSGLVIRAQLKDVRMNNRTNVRMVDRFVNSMVDIIRQYNISSLHMADCGVSSDIEWNNFIVKIDRLNVPIMIHDVSGKLDKYHLRDVIIGYHNIVRGPDDPQDDTSNIIDIESVCLENMYMPSVYVLVYCSDMEISTSLTERYHYAPISILNKKNKHTVKSLNGCVYASVVICTKDVAYYKSKYHNCKVVKTLKSIDKYYELTPERVDQAIFDMQTFINKALPNAYGIDTSNDVTMVATSDISVQLQMSSFDASRMHIYTPMSGSVTPVLRTAMSPPRPTNSLKELVKAIEKRNCAVPKIQVTMDVYAKALELYRKTIKYVYNDVPQYETVDISDRTMDEWLATQNSNISSIIQKIGIHSQNLGRYSLTIKKNSKPLLDMSCVNTYASLQTVVYTSKDYNTYFCPIFRLLKKNMTKSMSDKFVMYSDMSPRQFAIHLSKKLSRTLLNRYHSLEFDVSKYDKSQNLLHLLVDCHIMYHFGMSAEDVYRWFVGHAYTNIYDPTNRFASDVFFQRKSGDPSTWLLNTQQILVLIANVINEKQWNDVIMVMVSGDDSEIISSNKLSIYKKKFSDVFNYEVKVYDNLTSIYFCSKFLITTDLSVYLVPDIYKLIKKIGRHDLKNREHVLSYRYSVLDTLKDMVIPQNVAIAYQNAICERYMLESFVYQSLVDSLYTVATTDEAFERLYKKNENYYRSVQGRVSDI